VSDGAQFLPFGSGVFDVVLSNLVVHEMDTFAVGSAHGGTGTILLEHWNGTTWN
jgi:hypothetical protein